MSHMQWKLKDVGMEDIENMHAHNFDGFNDEMKIYNLADTKYVGERRGTSNTHEASG